MHIDIIPNRTSAPTVLLRESYREGNRVKKRTLANLSSLPMEQVEMIRQVLRGDVLMLIPVHQPDQARSAVALADGPDGMLPGQLRRAPGMHSSRRHQGDGNQHDSRAAQDSIHSLMATRKAGFGSRLAAAYLRNTAIESDFMVR